LKSFKTDSFKNNIIIESLSFIGEIYILGKKDLITYTFVY